MFKAKNTTKHACYTPVEENNELTRRLRQRQAETSLSAGWKNGLSSARADAWKLETLGVNFFIFPHWVMGQWRKIIS